MIPSSPLREFRHKPTLQENTRAFKVVGIFLASVVIAYTVIALLVFGHL